MTSYRQEAQRCAAYLVAHGPSKGRVLEVPNVTRVMADDHYGWFKQVQPGVYEVTGVGRAAGVGEP